MVRIGGVIGTVNFKVKNKTLFEILKTFGSRERKAHRGVGTWMRSNCVDYTGIIWLIAIEF